MEKRESHRITARPTDPARVRRHALPKPASRVEETYTSLLSLAHRLGPYAKLPTVRTLREEMNVSQATLDAALTRLEDQNVVVRRQGSGVYVSPRLRQRNIVLLCDPAFFLAHGTSPFWALLIAEIRLLAARNEAHLSLHFVNFAGEDGLEQPADPSPLPAWLRDEIAGGGVHGLLSIGAPHPVTRWIEAQGVPVVSYAGASDYIMGQSNAVLVQMGVAELARQNCRRIEPWFGRTSYDPTVAATTSHPFYEVYYGAMLANGLEPMPLAVLPDDSRYRDAGGTEEGFHLALHRLAPGARCGALPEAVLCLDDMRTQGLLMGMYRLGLKPGKDIRVATHCNAGSSVLLAWEDEIVRMEYDLADLVRLMFETLDALMNNERPTWEASAARVPEFMNLLIPRLLVPLIP